MGASNRPKNNISYATVVFLSHKVKHRFFTLFELAKALVELKDQKIDDKRIILNIRMDEPN